MPLSWIVIGCLTGRSLAQSGGEGGWAYLGKYFPCPSPQLRSPKMAARCQNAHSRAQNTPALQANEPEKYIISKVVLTSRSHFVSSILWKLSLKLLTISKELSHELFCPRTKLSLNLKKPDNSTGMKPVLSGHI